MGGRALWGGEREGASSSLPLAPWNHAVFAELRLLINGFVQFPAANADSDKEGLNGEELNDHKLHKP